jgi:hypothetical protein
MASLHQLKSGIWKPTSFGFVEVRSPDTIFWFTCDSYSISTCKCIIPQFNSLLYAWKWIINIDNSIGGQNLNHCTRILVHIYTHFNLVGLPKNLPL